MATIREAARARESRLFVGRERELEVLRAWLAPAAPQIPNVSGSGGVGKTALLRAFEREAGLPVVRVDGRTVPPTPAGVLSGLTGELPAFNFVTLTQGPQPLNVNVQVLVGPNLDIVTTLTAALTSNAGCPARWWAQAVTTSL